jgi:light-regulated signal transduction histidine kinase (bacteriophytochrome)
MKMATAAAEKAGYLPSSAEYSRAVLNILEDLTEDRERMRDTHRAMINILTDFRDEKEQLQRTQRAMQNILQDVDDERCQRQDAEQEVRRVNAHLEERVSVRTAQLELANQELEGFSYSVSHDLRTPLRAIEGFSSILCEDHADALDNEGRRLLNVIVDGTRRMSQLIDDILAFSRFGRVDMIVRSIDMTRLVHSVIDDLARETICPHLSFKVAPLLSAIADPATIRQVWVNLIGNAIKYTGRNETAVVEIGSRAEDGQSLFFVKDNGVGFDMQYADKLFGVFQRLHSVDEFAGTGIGLAIVKRIVGRHGGHIWAEGAINVGATFYFSLPAGETTHG